MFPFPFYLYLKRSFIFRKESSKWTLKLSWNSVHYQQSKHAITQNRCDLACRWSPFNMLIQGFQSLVGFQGSSWLNSWADSILLLNVVINSSQKQQLACVRSSYGRAAILTTNVNAVKFPLGTNIHVFTNVSQGVSVQQSWLNPRFNWQSTPGTWHCLSAIS